MAEIDPTQSTLPPDQQEKLRELTAQSWNLELVISGAALFAVLQLPDLLDQAFDYFLYNFSTGQGDPQKLLPMWAYRLMKAMGYVLFLAFLTNFVMRAFWVGLVGLLAVYPTGIHYERIPFSTPYTQKRMAADLGPLDRYILRLDQRCNIVFAVAFMFVIFLVVVALAYVVILLVSSILQPMLPTQIWHILVFVTYALGLLYFITSMVLSLPTVKAHPTGEKLHYQLTTSAKFIFWGMATPFGFLVNTFYSHLPYRKILQAMGLFMAVFCVVLTIELVANMARVDRRPSFNKRYLYSTRLDSLYSNPNYYDDQLNDGEYVSRAAIQSEIISEPFIRVFVAYPKALDTLLTKLTKEPVWSNTLSKTETRRRFAEWSHGQMSHLMQISINDSVYRGQDLLFAQWGKQQQPGWKTILIPANLRIGKNIIRISLESDSLAKPQVLAMIPFWYVPDK